MCVGMGWGAAVPSPEHSRFMTQIYGVTEWMNVNGRCKNVMDHKKKQCLLWAWKVGDISRGRMRGDRRALQEGVCSGTGLMENKGDLWETLCRWGVGSWEEEENTWQVCRRARIRCKEKHMLC